VRRRDAISLGAGTKKKGMVTKKSATNAEAYQERSVGRVLFAQKLAIRKVKEKTRRLRKLLGGVVP